jgi:N-acetylmuramoyl-L-alanine amidase
MLLTDTAELDPIVIAEIERLGVSTVYLLGQTAALSEDVETTLLEQGYVVERIGGEDRFETAALIAARVVGNGTLVYITEGLDLDPARGWPDAVSVAPLAAYEGRPILLVTTEEVPEHTFTALSNLGFTQARIIGGPAAVSEDVEEALEGLALEVERYAGEDRYETSRAVVDLELAVGMDPRRLWLATGAKFPDALVAGPAVAAERGVLLLTPQDDLDRAPTTRDFIAELDPTGLLIRLVGGPAAISDVVEQQIRALVGL